MMSRVKKLKDHKNFMMYFKNSSWMMIEYFLKIISGMFVTFYVARYLGPENFGILSYALAIIGICMVFSRLGMESILVRDLAKYPVQKKEYLGTAFSLMLISAFTGLMLLSLLIYFFETDSQSKTYIWIISMGLLLQTFLVIDYNFQAQVQAKYSSIAKSIAFGVGSFIKVYLVWIQADLVFFAISYALDHLIIAILLITTHLFRKEPNFIFVLKPQLIKPLLKSAWPIMLSALAVILYMRIDQIMIKNLLGVQQLGLYTAATKIYEASMTIPYVISVSLLPAIVKLKSTKLEIYELNMSKLFSVVFWGGIFVAIFCTLTSEFIISFTFGDSFIASKNAFIIVMWTSAFTALGSVSTRYLTVEGMERKIAFRSFVALISNIILNLLLIPLYGIEGAAMATLITIICVNYFINYLDKDLKQLIQIINKAIRLNFSLKNTKS